MSLWIYIYLTCPFCPLSYALFRTRVSPGSMRNLCGKVVWYCRAHHRNPRVRLFGHISAGECAEVVEGCVWLWWSEGGGLCWVGIFLSLLPFLPISWSSGELEMIAFCFRIQALGSCDLSENSEGDIRMQIQLVAPKGCMQFAAHMNM